MTRRFITLSSVITRELKNEVYLDRRIPTQQLGSLASAFNYDLNYKKPPKVESVPRSPRDLDSRFDQFLFGSTDSYTDAPFTPFPLRNKANLSLANEISKIRSERETETLALLFERKLADQCNGNLNSQLRKIFGSGINPARYRFIFQVPLLDSEFESLPKDYKLKKIVLGNELAPSEPIKETSEPDLLARFSFLPFRIFEFAFIQLREVFEKGFYRFELVK